MKILISPSKTKKIKEIKNKENNHIFQDKTNEIIEFLKKQDLNFFKKIYKKDDLATKYMNNYINFENLNSSKAIFSYEGLVFKNIQIEEITDLEYVNNHLLIFSGLYGLLRPNDNIVDYRLDFENKLDGFKNLYDFFKTEINEYLKNEDILINLASNEYSKILNLDNVYTLEFYKLNKDGKYVKQSTDSKQKRGKFVNYILKNKIETIEEIKKIKIGNLKYIEGKNPKILEFYEF